VHGERGVVLLRRPGARLGRGLAVTRAGPVQRGADGVLDQPRPFRQRRHPRRVTPHRSRVRLERGGAERVAHGQVDPPAQVGAGVEGLGGVGQRDDRIVGPAVPFERGGQTAARQREPAVVAQHLGERARVAQERLGGVGTAGTQQDLGVQHVDPRTHRRPVQRCHQRVRGGRRR
jgi:hypothetical protein